LTRALSGGRDPAAVDLWAWLGRQNPLLAQLGSLTGHPEGLRLLPAASPGNDFSPPPEPAPEPAADHLELLLVDWTFGTEELAAYAPILQEAEVEPALSLHPGDAARAGLAEGDRAILHLPGGSLSAAVHLAANQAPGVAVLPRHRRLDWRKLAETPVFLAFNHLEREPGVQS
jgi:hypothetical protein